MNETTHQHLDVGVFWPRARGLDASAPYCRIPSGVPRRTRQARRQRPADGGPHRRGRHGRCAPGRIAGLPGNGHGQHRGHL